MKCSHNKKIFHSFQIIGSRQFGGCEHFYMRFIRLLNSHGYSALAVIRPGSPVGYALGQEIPQAKVPMRNGWDFFSTFTIRKMIQNTQPAIVQTYMGRATRLTRLPSRSRSVHVARLGGYYKIRGYYEHAHAWVGNTRGLCDYMIREGLNAERIYYIGNFVDTPPATDEKTLSELRQSLKIPDEAIIIFSLGRFIEIKGFGDLLSAFSRLSGEVGSRPLYLIIAGDGPIFKQLRKQAEMLNITSRMRWVGWQSNPTPYFHLADIFVCASRKETLGNVILEAWAHQIPVVSTRTPGGVELISNGENGLLTPISDPKALSECTRELLKEGPDTWRSMAKKGFSTLKKNHSQESVLRAYLDLYEDLSYKYGQLG